MSATPILFENGMLVDGTSAEPAGPFHVLVEAGTIREVSATPIASACAQTLDLRGRILMPGLIDCHAHPTLTEMAVATMEGVPQTLNTARASSILRRMLDRGFTTIRDASGGDWGLQQAVAEGQIPGPRIFISGRALTQTGGHGDLRRRTDHSHSLCSCGHSLQLAFRVADGVDDIIRAVREELRLGANQIKVMVSGGVSSPNDPLDSCQYSPEELRAAVSEAQRWGTYVLAHAYTPQAITHAVNCGVRTIEHANLIDGETASLCARNGVYVVPTLVTYDALEQFGPTVGLTQGMLSKLTRVREAGLRSIELCVTAGVKLGFGTDLLGMTHDEQSREFLIRREVQPAHEIIASATRIGAEIVRQVGRLGVIAPGAVADLLVVDGNPLANLGLLQDQGRHLAVIMKDGKFHKNTLHD